MQTPVNDVSNLIHIKTGLKPPAHLRQLPGSCRVPVNITPDHTITCDPAQLSSDLGSLLKSGEGADVELRCSAGEVLRAHLSILSACWEWFRVRQASGLTAGIPDTVSDSTYGESAESQQEAVESQQEACHTRVVVDTSGHSAAAMQLVLQHLYTGRLTLTVSSICAEEIDKPHLKTPYIKQLTELLTAAAYYLLPDLHAAALALAGQLFKPLTVLRWLQAAQAAKESALEEAALEYTKAHIAGGYVCSPCTCMSIV
jgi:hypothetical protein